MSNGGVIAILGIDGSGKSSLLATLHVWLRLQGPVKKIYFGSGDGPMSLARRVVALTGKARHALRLKRQAPTPIEHDISLSEKSSCEDTRLRIRYFMDHLLIARERKRSIRQMIRVRSKGGFVLADRFPQAQLLGGMDGPKLSRFIKHRFWLVRRLVAWEKSVYEYGQNNGPDLVIVLDLGVETARKRAHSHTVAQLKERIRQIETFEFPLSRVVHIDAEQTLEQVANKAKVVVREAFELDDRQDN